MGRGMGITIGEIQCHLMAPPCTVSRRLNRDTNRGGVVVRLGGLGFQGLQMAKLMQGQPPRGTSLCHRKKPRHYFGGSFTSDLGQ